MYKLNDNKMVLIDIYYQTKRKFIKETYVNFIKENKHYFEKFNGDEGFHFTKKNLDRNTYPLYLFTKTIFPLCISENVLEVNYRKIFIFVTLCI